MSLKARLRFAVALLMGVVVVIVSGFYIRTNLNATLGRAEDTANSVADQLRAAVQEQLERAAVGAEPAISSAEQAKTFWIERVSKDPVIAGSLSRAVTYWPLISEVLITDASGRVLATSRLTGTTERREARQRLGDWSKRSLIDNLKQIYLDRTDSEVSREIGVAGDSTPIVVVHAVVSTLMIREALSAGLPGLLAIGITALTASLVLALALPLVVLDPLERLSRRLEVMASGTFGESAATKERETKEFAAVYSKLDVLGQRYMGARDDVDQLRGRIEQLLSRLEEAVLLFDAKGRLTMAGSGVTRLLGRTPAELDGCTVDQIFPSLTEIGATVIPAVRAGETVTGREVKSTNGKTSLLVSVQPLRNGADGTAKGALVRLRDADTRGELVARLDVASRLAALSQLTRGVAHEIKNPLNAIRLHVEVLRGRLEEPAPEVDVIAREISRLDRVVKTFLDFNKPVEPHLRAVDVNALAREIAALVTPEASARGVQFTVKTAPDPVVVNGDLDLLKQAVLNVVMNGVEAMTSGGTLTIETRHEDGRVEVLIADTGPGIPEEVQDKIFNLYFTTKQRGSGMGLAIAYRFAQLNDGRIEFTSNAGRGATFRFSFPEAASNPDPGGIELSRMHRA